MVIVLFGGCGPSMRQVCDESKRMMMVFETMLNCKTSCDMEKRAGSGICTYSHPPGSLVGVCSSIHELSINLTYQLKLEGISWDMISDRVALLNLQMQLEDVVRGLSSIYDSLQHFRLCLLFHLWYSVQESRHLVLHNTSGKKMSTSIKRRLYCRGYHISIYKQDANKSLCSR